MTCIVFGGSGQIGHFLLPRLRARDISVAAFSRQPRPTTGGVLWMQGCLPDDVPAPQQPANAIISLGPLDHFTSWLDHARVPGAPRIVAMSSMSAESKSDSPDPAERALAQRLRASEQNLLARCAELGCDCTLLRATLIYGTGMDRSLTPIVRRALHWRVFPLPRGRGLRQPVHAEDLALAVLAALDCPTSAGQIIAVGGGERLSATAMFQRVRASVPRRTVPLALPRWVLALVARLSGRGRGVVSRLPRDLVADNTKLVGLLGVQPRPFEPLSAHWEEPGHDMPGTEKSDNH